MAGLYLQLGFSFYKSTILRRAWAISPEFFKKKRERKRKKMFLWSEYESYYLNLINLAQKKEPNGSILCHILQNYQSCPLPVIAVTVLCIGMWWQEDDLSLAIFRAVLFSCQDVIFPGQNSGSSPYLSTYYKVPTKHMQNSLPLNTYFHDVKCSPI